MTKLYFFVEKLIENLYAAKPPATGRGAQCSVIEDVVILLQVASGTFSNGAQGIICDGDRKPRLLMQQIGYAAQQGSTAGHHDADVI